MKQYNTKDKLIIVREALKTNKYKKVCLNYEISTRTLYNWLSKVRRYGMYIETLTNKNRVPKNSPNKICLF